MRANKTIQDYLKSFHKDEMVVLRRGDKIRDNAVLLLSPMEMELLIALAYDRAMRRERRFLDRLDPLALSDEELMRYYRFPRRELMHLIRELEPQLQRRTRRVHAIPAHTQVLMALRILASGSFQHVIGDVCGRFLSSVIPSNKTTLFSFIATSSKVLI